MNRTTVVNVRGHKPIDFLGDPDFVYVGRAVWGWPASIWGNPFRVGPGRDAAAAVRLYRDRLELALEDPATRRLLELLRGKRLGCWCCNWDGTGEPARPCHAVELARLADEGRDDEIDRYIDEKIGRG